MNFIWQNKTRAVARQTSKIDNSIYYSLCAYLEEDNDWHIYISPLKFGEVLLLLIERNWISLAESKKLKLDEIAYLESLDKIENNK